MQQLTVKEALEQGYKYCCVYQEEGYWKIEEGLVFLPYTKYLLATKDPEPYTISDDVIKDLVNDYFFNQEDVYDENGKMNDLILEKVDFSNITRQINEAISSVKYYYPTDIQLIP